MPTEHPAEATFCHECGRRLMLFADRCPECVPRIARRHSSSGAWFTALVVLAGLAGLALLFDAGLTGLALIIGP